jgi:hypothetical protein
MRQHSNESVVGLAARTRPTTSIDSVHLPFAHACTRAASYAVTGLCTICSPTRDRNHSPDLARSSSQRCARAATSATLARLSHAGTASFGPTIATAS